MDAAGVIFVDLEFDTGTHGVAMLGDVAASLVSVDELLRDLASIAADPSNAEFRKVEIVAIQMHSPLKVRLSLFGISAEALTTFQEICRHIIARRQSSIDLVLQRCLPPAEHARITAEEAQRLHGHVATLQNAAIPLKRAEVLT